MPVRPGEREAADETRRTVIGARIPQFPLNPAHRDVKIPACGRLRPVGGVNAWPAAKRGDLKP